MCEQYLQQIKHKIDPPGRPSCSFPLCCAHNKHGERLERPEDLSDWVGPVAFAHLLVRLPHQHRFSDDTLLPQFPQQIIRRSILSFGRNQRNCLKKIFSLEWGLCIE